jgi:hypothetical protein
VQAKRYFEELFYATMNTTRPSVRGARKWGDGQPLLNGEIDLPVKREPSG